jgi:hypothetical protein
MSDRHAALTGTAAPALPPEAFLALDEMEAQAHYNALAAQRIEAAIRRHMRQDLHYTYTLGGARFDKPVLLDAGIAFLMRMLRLVPRHRLELALREPVPVIGPDGSIAGHRLLIKYVVRAELWHIGPDGSERLVAEGLGSASSLETRHLYRWVTERHLPPGVDRSALPARTREVGGRRITEYRIVNPDPDDLDNTLIKVAAKRAEADAVRQLPGVLEACAVLPDVEMPQPPAGAAPPPSGGEARSSPEGEPLAWDTASSGSQASGQQAAATPVIPATPGGRRQSPPRERSFDLAEADAQGRLVKIAQEVDPAVSWYITIARLLGLPSPERGMAAIREHWLGQGRTWRDALARVQEQLAPPGEEMLLPLEDSHHRGAGKEVKGA